MITIEKKVHFGRGKRSQRVLKSGKEIKPKARIPRISKLMALAIRFDQLIREGVVKDQAELARLGYVTRARLTQIMNLLHLAPDIQEELLFLEPIQSGREKLTERYMRPIVENVCWERQREMWRELSIRTINENVSDGN